MEHEETDRKKNHVDWEVCQYQNEQLYALSLQCRQHKKYRRALEAKKDSGELLQSLGVVLPEGIDARFVVNTNDTWYFVMPQRPKWDGQEEQELVRNPPV